VLELTAMLLSLQLLIGRRRLWLPSRLRKVELSEAMRLRMSERLLPRIRRLERFSHPRLAVIMRHRLFGVVYGALVLVLTVTAFVAPPFTGLDTLPAMGIVLLSLAVLFEDLLLAFLGLLVGAAGVATVFLLGRATLELIF
jgi:hypothetical protein